MREGTYLEKGFNILEIGIEDGSCIVNINKCVHNARNVFTLPTIHPMFDFVVKTPTTLQFFSSETQF
jgi:hypothetical protein